ncbi:MAG: TldD/PmbA family protein [Candidatus Aminicenantes bacterium]|nr:MAG: TldD/PmbA family protein [Candidatus Aminicenantes bacterium]
MRDKSKSNKIRELAESLVDLAKAKGADEAEISIFDGYEFSVDVRLGEIENLVEAGSRLFSSRVIKDKKTAFSTSSDLSKETLQKLLENSLKRANLANPDEFSGLPPLTKKKIDILSLELFDPEIPKLDSKRKIDLAKETEKIALADKRISNSHGASFATREIKTVLANSNGFLQEYVQTSCSLSVGLQAGQTDSKVEDFWFSAKSHFKDLETPEQIAKKAIERTVRQLNPRKIKTQIAPVIFESMMTSWLLGFLFACVSGVSIYQKTSFLANKLGERIGNEKITVYDDGLLPGELGTRPFDAEGVPCQKTQIVDKGILKNYLCNTYAARKLKLRSTGNSSGVGVSPNNFYMQPGETSPEKILTSLEKGLILIRTLGHGLNPVTGDISRGAFGLWVEKGEIVYPVSEITISGNLGEILEKIEIVGNDLEFRSPVSGPTVKVQEMMVAGK